MEYTVKCVRGAKERIYPCDGYNNINLPESGYYKDHPELLGLPRGQVTKLELEDGKGTVILLPRDGTYAYVINNGTGVTIDRYPKGRRWEKKVEKKEKELRVVATETVETDRDGL